MTGATTTLLLATALASAGPAAAPAPSLATLTERLPALVTGLPEGFKALVLALPAAGASGARGAATARFDYRNTAADRGDWWPASTVKLFAAIAALETTHRLGLPPTARATFHYDDGDGEGRARTLRVDFLVRQALVPSNNLCFDLLVELVGCAALNDGFLTAANGLGATTLLRSYAARVRHPTLGSGTHRLSPAVTLAAGDREVALPARHDDAPRDCPGEGNCTTLADLAEALRRVMLHEELPPAQRFALGEAELAVLRGALGAGRRRGNGVVEGLRRGFGRGLRVWHKPGYAQGWFSDVVFVTHQRTGRRWVVAMAGHGGRGVLDGPARAVGALLRQGALDGGGLSSAPESAR
jgi:hypothetical protein